MADQDVKVRFGADTSDVKDGVSSLQADLRARFDAMRASMAEFAAGAKESTAKAKESFEGLHESLEGVNKGMEGLAKAAKMVGEIMAAGAIGEAIHELMEKTGEYGESIESAGQRTGMGVEKIQQLRFAAQMSGVDFQGLSQSMALLSVKMQGVIKDGSPVAEAFSAIGLHGKEIKDANLEDVLMKMATAFHGAEDGAAKQAVAMELLGRSGAQLIPFLNKGAAGIQELMKRASDLGIVLDESAIKKSAELAEQMKELQAVHEATSVQIGMTLAPAFMAISKAFETNLKDGGAFKQFLSGLSSTMSMAASLASHVAQGFQEMGIMIGATMAQVNAMMHGEWGGFKQIAADEDADLQKLAASYNKFRDDLSKPVEAPKIEGEGESAPKNKLKYNPQPEKQPKSNMPELEAELAQAKVDYETLKGLQGEYVTYSKEQEIAFWQSKIGMGAKGTSDNVAIQRKANEAIVASNKQQFDAHIASLKTEEEAEKNHYDKQLVIARGALMEIGQAYGWTSKEASEAAAKINEIEQQKAEAAKKVALEIIAAHEKVALTEIETATNDLDRQVALGKLTAQGKIQIELQYAAQKLKIEQQAADAEAAVQEEGTEEYQKALDKRAQATADYAKDVAKLNAQAADQSKKDWESMTSGLQSTLTQSFSGILMGTTTLQKGFQKLCQGMMKDFVDMCAEMAAKWVMNQLAQTAIAKSAMALRESLLGTTVPASVAAAKVEAAGVVPANAAMAATGAAAAVAPIPIVGPEMATDAFDEMMALCMGSLSLVSSAGGEWNVPSDRLNLVHKNETIMPAKVAQPMREFFEGGGQGSSSPNIHIHATDSQDVARLFKNNGQALARAAKEAMRNFRK